ncbi:MAG: 2-succinyl-5-enolpyruvyl-6-hydroxy-3-cyclohexene-1-carboxylic-acid synthase [Cyanobacteria bacterium P01_A01_bin.17]
MTLDFRNLNMLWSSLLIETLQRLGLETVIVCPGSRSGPLAVAVAEHPKIEAIPILDERSAAFFALGLARRTGIPVALICTSGTAGANFYPAIIEAHEGRVPLLILTADRPPELRHCHAGQAIDQVKMFAHYPSWQAELSLPSPEPERLTYLRQTMVHAWMRSQRPTPGPVHLNIPFRDPLAPIPDLKIQSLASEFDTEHFFAAVQTRSPSTRVEIPEAIWEQWRQCEQGVIIAGPSQPLKAREYCLAIATLAQHLSWPILAEGLSPLRNFAHLNPLLVSSYDLMLRDSDLADLLTPHFVIRVGELPTSKILRSWLQTTDPQQWLIAPEHHNLDPLHSRIQHLPLTVQQLAEALPRPPSTQDHSEQDRNSNPYLKQWLTADQQTRRAIDQTLAKIDELLEPKVSWVLSQHLPTDTPLFIANSMPIRDVEAFWQPNHLNIQPYGNRGGANGIDGTLSTALGIAHRHHPTVLLTGDLALLHDTNGFLHSLKGHLTIILINNNGGGIFEMLPIAQFDPAFEAFFATPQQVDFAQLGATYGVTHTCIQSWEHLIQLINPLPTEGIRVLEVRCDRKLDTQWRRQQFQHFGDIKST